VATEAVLDGDGRRSYPTPDPRKQHKSRKYRRLRSMKRFMAWWTGLTERQPGLFAHWRWVRIV